jgi:hypothetical protein
MHSVPEAGGGDGTNWHAYDVPAIWSMVEDFDCTPQWKQVSGWEKAFQLAGQHLFGVKSYRDQLAAAWPPETNEASRVYVAELDKLIASIQATYDAAIANHSAMSAATGVISGLRSKLKPIYDRWQSQASAMADYEAKVAATRSGTPAPIPGPPPLAPGWRDELNEQARDIMNTASGELALASYRVATPPGYTAPNVLWREDPPPGSKEPTGLVPPVIAPSVPRPAPAPVHPPLHAPIGPTLASTPSTPAQGPLPSTSPVPPTIIGPSPVPVALISTTPLPSDRPLKLSGPPPSTGGRGAPPTATGHINGTGAASRPMPVGGLIGGPATGLIMHSPARPTQNVNPVGGVIGGVAPGSAGPSTRGSTSSVRGVTSLRPAFRTADGHFISIRGMRAERRTAGPTDEWDPDDPWAIGEGVPPVLDLPSPITRHDPGPAIGLHQGRGE